MLKKEQKKLMICLKNKIPLFEREKQKSWVVDAYIRVHDRFLVKKSCHTILWGRFLIIGLNKQNPLPFCLPLDCEWYLSSFSSVTLVIKDNPILSSFYRHRISLTIHGDSNKWLTEMSISRSRLISAEITRAFKSKCMYLLKRPHSKFEKEIG